MANLKLKNQDLTVRIPLLRDETTFRSWDESLIRYLGTLALKHYVFYDVQTPLTLLTEEKSSIYDESLTRILSTSMNNYFDESIILRIPEHLKALASSDNRAKMYCKAFPTIIPRDLVKLALSATILTCNQKLYLLYDSPKQHRLQM